MNSILLLFQFFTRIPVKMTLDYSPESFEKSSRLLVFFGFLSGIPLFLLIYGATFFKSNASILSIIILLFWIMMTGGFHLDGLTDTCDGFFSGRKREKILEIMKDSRVGSYGAIALFVDLIMKQIIIMKLIEGSYPMGIILMMAAGKFSLLTAGYYGKRAKENSSGNVFIIKGNKFKIPLGVIFMLILGYFSRELIKIALGTVAIIISVFVFLRKAERTIGGITGDNLGFASEIGELIIGFLLIWK